MRFHCDFSSVVRGWDTIFSGGVGYDLFVVSCGTYQNLGGGDTIFMWEAGIRSLVGVSCNVEMASACFSAWPPFCLQLVSEVCRSTYSSRLRDASGLDLMLGIAVAHVYFARAFLQGDTCLRSNLVWSCI